MVKLILNRYVLLVCLIHIGTLLPRMEPVKKEGKYYYSEQDTHKHIDLPKALSFLTRKMLSPSAWVAGITSLFYAKPQEHSNPIALLNPTRTVPAPRSMEPKITWIGHATFLIQMNNFNVLTDPIFGDVKLGPLSITKRGMPAGIQFQDLPPIDAIVISHNHSDHLDTNALTALNTKYHPIVCVPEGNKPLLCSMGFDESRVIENTWWDTYTLEKNNHSLKISCLPAYHWSIRFSLGSYRKSLWSSWMISANDTNIYFAGDTAYGPHFKEIAQDFPSIDVALMPIAPTEEGENSHKLYHIDALEAVDAFIDLKAKTFVPMHYGTFFVGKNTVDLPVRRLKEHWQECEAQLTGKDLLMARCGVEYNVTQANRSEDGGR